jgi:TRAP-type C4-dicarboxylate transport system permease small subunit
MGSGAGLIRALDRVIHIVIAAIYVAIVLAMFAQVVFRYALGSPLTWSEEAARYLFVWLCYLGAYVAIVRNAHVGVDYLTRHFSPALQRALAVVMSCLIIAALGFVAYEGAFLTLDNVKAEWSTIPALSMGLAFLAVPLGAVLMIIGMLRLILSQFRPAGPGDAATPVL